MGMEIELDSEENCTSDLSPNTVLPYRHCSKSKLLCKDDVLRVKGGFTEISFRRYRSASCKNVPSRSVGLEGNIELKRGSVYQSSREARKMKKMSNKEDRRKIELSRGSDTSLSFSIVDSLCSSDEENAQPALSLNSNLMHFLKHELGPYSGDGFIEICPDLDKREKQSAVIVGSDPIENQKFRCDLVVGPLDDGNDLLERDMALTFQKSLSAKLELPHSPSPSEGSDSSTRGSSKSRFSTIRRMFDPFMKSKSLRSPLGETGDFKTNMKRNQTYRKSLLHDFSYTAQISNFDSQLIEKDHHHADIACSPVHLRGCLKLENKHGVPFFEFILNCPEEVLIAKTWKASNAFSWVYTFHSISNRKKSNASGWRLTDGNKESSILGQMQVSSYLNSELKDGVFENSMVTEFVLYDIAHARQVSTQDPPDVMQPPSGSTPGIFNGTQGSDDGSDALNLKHQKEHAFSHSNFDSSNPYPWPSAILHPYLEIATTVIQIPLTKRESLKYKRGDKSGDKLHSNLLKLSMDEQRRKSLPDRDSSEKVKVVIPTGHHGLPNDESQSPSSLLDRWRLGGGCDCGGWDMACPLSVFGSPGIQCTEDQPLIDNQRPLELFVQGMKENTPALSMKVVEKGQYEIDFHARLSTLQAFSICVALLHGSEASGVEVQERSKQLPHCNSLKVLIDEEVKLLIERITEEEQKKASKKMEDIQQSYALNPPFSPIGRV